MTSLDVIRRLHGHRAWVSAQLMNAAEMLTEVQLHRSFEIGRGSVWASLVHLYAAELNWLEAIEGNQNPALLGDNAFDSLPQLEPAWAALEGRWRSLLSSLTESELPRMVAKVSGGKLQATPLVDVLLHVCTHAHYTTAQTVNMLRRLGIPPTERPDNMLITMSRREHARA